jgi:hypothetical protein
VSGQRHQFPISDFQLTAIGNRRSAIGNRQIGQGDTFDRLSACLTLANAIAHEVGQNGAVAAMSEEEATAFRLLNISPERLQAA